MYINRASYRRDNPGRVGQPLLSCDPAAETQHPYEITLFFTKCFIFGATVSKQDNFILHEAFVCFFVLFIFGATISQQ